MLKYGTMLGGVDEILTNGNELDELIRKCVLEKYSLATSTAFKEEGYLSLFELRFFSEIPLCGSNFKIKSEKTLCGFIEAYENCFSDFGDENLTAALERSGRLALLTVDLKTVMLAFADGLVVVFDPQGNEGGSAFLAYFNSIEEFMGKYAFTKHAKECFYELSYINVELSDETANSNG